MSNKKLKSLLFFYDESAKEYQLWGTYKNLNRGSLPDEPEIEQIMIDHGTADACVRSSMVKINSEHDIDCIDLVSETLVESLAKLSKGDL